MLYFAAVLAFWSVGLDLASRTVRQFGGGGPGVVARRLDRPQRFGAGNPEWLPESPLSKAALGRPSVFRPHREAAITVMATDHEPC